MRGKEIKIKRKKYTITMSREWYNMLSDKSKREILHSKEGNAEKENSGTDY